MRQLARRFLVILCTFALVAGSTISFAAPVFPSDPCAHEHSHHDGLVPAQHDHHADGCLACCLGACIAMADLPQQPSLSVVVFAASAVTYWETGVSLSGREIAPDPAPPKTIA